MPPPVIKHTSHHTSADDGNDKTLDAISTNNHSQLSPATSWRPAYRLRPRAVRRWPAAVATNL